ncbi:MAG: hypothetical protein K8R99_13540 [Actinomycetia bacterium]|nr:hypothetical protein [Actinomycetes bacterium]
MLEPGRILDLESDLDPLTDELAAIREGTDGSLPMQDALDLFASAFGEMPGGNAARFEGSTEFAELAIREVMRHWQELTSEQQDTVRALRGNPGQASSLLASPPDTTSDSELEAAKALAAEAQAAIAARLGIELPFPIEISLVHHLGALHPELVPPGSTGIAGMTWPLDEDGELAMTGGDVVRCAIDLQPPVNPGTVYHEIFHCFQYALTGDASLYWSIPGWISEGSAVWATNEFVDDYRTPWIFQQWILSTRSLYSMSYEAFGYYLVLDSMGVSTWDVIGDMLTSGGNEAAVAASGLEPMRVLSRVVTSKARARSVSGLPVSDIWDFSAANVPRDGYFTDATVSPGSPSQARFGLRAFAAAPVEVIHVERGSVLQVALHGDVGALEFFGQQPIEWNDSLVRSFCLDEGGCVCGADELEHGAQDLILGVGQLHGGSARVDVRVADIAFTDGNWAGTISSPDLTISGAAGSGFRPGAEAAINFTVEDGAVTSGTYGLQFPAIFDSPVGTGSGVVSIAGQVVGCGYAPELEPTTLVIDATVELSAGFSIPMQAEIDFAAGTITVEQAGAPPQTRPLGDITSTSTGFTSWLIETGSTPTNRVGQLEATAELATMTAAGFAVGDFQFRFDISRA